MTLFYQSFVPAIGVAGGSNAQPVIPGYAIAANGLGLCWSTDAFIAFTLWKPYSSTAASVLTGTDAQWSQLGSSTSGTVASGVSTGSVRMTSWSGRITSNLTDVADLDTGVTTATTGLSKGLFFRATNAAGQHNTISRTRVGLADTDESGTAVSATGTATTDQIRTGDWVAICVGIKDDAPTHTSQSLTIAGCTLGTLTWFTKESTTSGVDLAMYTGYAQVTAGSSTGAVTYAATSSVSGASAAAAELVVLREDSQPFIKTDDPGGWVVSWANPAGVSVDLQRSASITSPAWSTIYTGTGATYTDTAKSAGQKFFYRIVMDGANSAVSEAVQLPFTEDFSTTGATGRPWLNWRAEGQMAVGDATDPASVVDTRVTINSGIGRLAGDGVTAATGSRAYAGVRQSVSDHAVSGRYRFQNATSVSAFRVSLRADTYSSSAGVLPLLGYTLRIDPTTAQVGMYDFELVGNAGTNQLTVLSESRGSGAVATLVANSWYRFRFEVFGTGTPTVRYRIWADGASEPTTWATADASTAPRVPVEGTLLIGAGFNAETTAFLDIDEIGYYNPNAPTLVSADDTAAAAEALSLAVQVSASDTAAAVDSAAASGSNPVLGLWSAPIVANTTSASTSKSATETASSADTASAARSSTATDTASSADVASVAVAAAAVDTAAAVDAASVTRSSTAADTASSADAATLATTSTATDTGTATDTASVTSQTKSGSDTASSTDSASAPVVAVSAADTAAAVDDAIRVVFVTGSDAATSTDAASSTAQLTADAPVTAADTAAVGVTQTVTGSDTASGADSAAVTSATSTATDTAAVADAATLAADRTATETAASTESGTAAATLVATPDTAASADTASAGRTSAAADSAAAVDSAALYTDAATYFDDFTRGVDQANQLGGNWAQVGGSSMGTSSGRVVAGTGAGVARYTFAVPAPATKQVSQLVYVGGSFIGPTVAMQAFTNGASFSTSGDFYIFRQQGSGNGIHIARRDAVGAVYNTLVSSTRNAVAGDVMRLEYDGTTLNAYINHALVLTTNPASPISGQNYVGFAHGSTSQSGTLLIDDWTGGLPLAAVTLTSADTATAVDDTSLAAGQNVSGTDSASAADTATVARGSTATDAATAADTSTLAAAVLVNATFSDDFNRADGALGANWISNTTAGSSASIVSNQLVAGAGTNLQRYAAPVPAGGTQYSQLTVKVAGADVGPSVGMNAFTLGTAAGVQSYDLRYVSSALRIFVRDADGSTSIPGSYAYVPQIGDVLRIESDGTQVRGYVNGVLRLTGTNSVYASNPYVGFCQTSGVSGAIADDWSGGVVAGGTPTDSSTAVDASTVTRSSTASDTGSTTDSASVTAQSSSAADTASGTDAASVTRTSDAADTATAADSANLAATVLVNQTFADDFNRANAQALGANWVTTHLDLPLGVLSNKLRGNDNAAQVIRWSTLLPLGPQFSQMTSEGVLGVGPAVCINNFASGSGLTGSRYYSFTKTATGTDLSHRDVNGGHVLATQSSVQVAAGSVMRLEYNGTTLRGYIDGALVQSVSTTQIPLRSDQSVGIWVGSNITTTSTLLGDDWSGGVLGGVVGDTATATDAAAAPAVAVSAADTAAAVDTAARVSVTGADSATAADSAALVAAPAVADTATAADSAGAPRIIVGDTATAVDVATVAVTLAGSDTANGLDMADLFGSGAGGVTLNISESASSADTASVTRDSTVSDTASAADAAALAATRAATDTASSTDSAALTAAPAVSDTATGADTATVGSVAITASDTASASDTAAVLSVVTAADAATAVDGLASDTWNDQETWDDQKPWDSQGLTASLAGTDAATAVDSASVFVLVAATDLAAAADSAAVTVLTTLISAADSAVTTDTASAYELLGQLWPRPRSRAPALVGQLWPRR